MLHTHCLASCKARGRERKREREIASRHVCWKLELFSNTERERERELGS